MKLKLIYKNANLKIEEYSPTIFQPLYKKVDHMYFKKWIRFIISSLSGGKIYYLSENEKLVGYCMVVKGKSYRYHFADNNDIIVGPIYLIQESRGKKYSALLLKHTLDYYNKAYGFNKAFAYIWRTNIASNKLFLREGFKITNQLEIKKISRNIYISNNKEMNYQLFEYDNSKTEVNE